MSIPGDDTWVENAGGTYKIASLADFRAFRDRVSLETGWTEKYKSDTIQVYVQQSPADGPGAGLNIVKVVAFYPNVSCDTMYDALHDPEFRKTWDFNMIEGLNICQLDPRNDIGYYSVKFPFPLANRDFVNQRRWMEYDTGEYIIMNNSVKHANAEPKKGFVRGLSYLTGYYLKPTPGGGCQILYMTHSDPQGSIPHAVLNTATTRMAPSLFDKMGKNGENYAQWAQEHYSANFVPPWRTPKLSWDADLQRPTPSLLTRPEADGAFAVADVAGPSAADDGGERPHQSGADTEVVDRRYEPRGASIAPVAPRNNADNDVIQKYRALMDEACRFVDQQFLEEGRSPTLEEYIARLHVILDAQRMTAPRT